MIQRRSENSVVYRLAQIIYNFLTLCSVNSFFLSVCTQDKVCYNMNVETNNQKFCVTANIDAIYKTKRHVLKVKNT